MPSNKKWLGSPADDREDALALRVTDVLDGDSRRC